MIPVRLAVQTCGPDAAGLTSLVEGLRMLPRTEASIGHVYVSHEQGERLRAVVFVKVDDPERALPEAVAALGHLLSRQSVEVRLHWDGAVLDGRAGTWQGEDVWGHGAGRRGRAGSGPAEGEALSEKGEHQ